MWSIRFDLLRALAWVFCLGVNAASASTVVLYDAGKNTLPDAQGWTYIPVGVASVTVAGGALSFSTTTFAATQAGFGRIDQALDTVAGYDLSLFGLTLVSESHSSTNRAGFSLLSVGSATTKAIELAFWNNEVWAYAFTSGAFVHGAGLSMNTTTAHDYTLRVRNNQWSLGVDGVFGTLGGSLVDYTPAQLILDPYEVPNTLFFGDDTSSASASVSLRSIALTTVPLPAAAWLFAGALASLLPSRRRTH